MTFGKIGARKIMWDVNNLLPKGARWVEYLESTGTQCVDTGVFPNGGTDFELCMFVRYIYWQNAFGARNVSGGLPAWGLIAHGTGHWSIDRLGSAWNTYIPFDVGAVHTYAFINGVALYDGEPKGIESGNVQVNYPALLFAYNSGGSIALYDGQCVLGCKIWQDGILVRDFHPIAIGNKGYMLDLVTGEYERYGNKGTGEFVIGPTIAYPERERE